MDALDVKKVAPDALGPADIVTKAETIAVGKTKMTSLRTFLAALLAGAFIAFGGTYFCVFLGDTTLPFGVQRVVGGICFCLGLVLVLCCGCELFTGNSLMMSAKASKKITCAQLLKNWGIVWVGNLVGALIAVFLMYMSKVQVMNHGEVAMTMVNVAAGKVALDPVTMFFKGIMCNVFVCLAVWIGFGARTTVDKVIGIILPISAFVALGFEHCVANMSFLPMGLLLNSMGVGAAGAVSLQGVITNLVIVTIGNVVGGSLVALVYRAAYGTTKNSGLHLNISCSKGVK